MKIPGKKMMRIAKPGWTVQEITEAYKIGEVLIFDRGNKRYHGYIRSIRYSSKTNSWNIQVEVNA